MEPIGNGLPPCGHGGNTAPSIGIIRTGTKGLSQHVGPFGATSTPARKRSIEPARPPRECGSMLRRRSAVAGTTWGGW
ncbi:uncharacterized protein AruCF_4775 [Achromobacter ruhlandii]|nr:uncharacterized protein AruCF_4775 [Achromobacter ruhlandii]